MNKKDISVLQEVVHIKNTVVLISLYIQYLHLMYFKVSCVLVPLGTLVHPQIILDPDYLPHYLSVANDYDVLYKTTA